MFERLTPEHFDEHRVLEFNDCAARPDAVLVDSSFLRSALRRTDRHKVEAVAFLDHLDLAGTEMTYSAYAEFCTGSGSMPSAMRSQISWKNSA